MTKRGDQTVLEIELVNAESSELDISLRGDQLFVRVRDIQRRICVPDSVAGRSVSSASMNDGVLEVAFEA